jgi:4-amino-4-deoxy-L-arabinose transferase-like glycosyltransferase
MILLAASVLLLGVIAWSLDRFAAVDGETRAARATRMLLWAFATVVVVEAGLGALRLLAPLATFVVLMVLAPAAWMLARPRPVAEPPTPEPISRLAISLLATVIAVFLFRLWPGLGKTSFLYDTLSYHLHVPATWMHDRRITVVPAVFGDPSPAYAPSNVELWFLFLMAPLRSDYLASVGQLPFAALAVAAIATVVRDAGGFRVAALAAALLFVLIPEVWGQMPTAMTDLAFAACLAASLPFAIRLWTARERRRGDLLAAATAIGLAIGTKYAAAALALPFIGLTAGGWLRRRPIDLPGSALAFAVALATGGFWYVRNAAVTGNPLYPVAVPGTGLRLPALYGRPEMWAWDYHVPIADVRELGSLLLGGGIGFCFAFAVAFARLWNRDLGRAIGYRHDDTARARSWRNVMVGLLIVLVVIFWCVIPYQESRFLFAIFAVAAALIGQVAQGSIHAAGAIAIALVCAPIEWPIVDRLLLIPVPFLPRILVPGTPDLSMPARRRTLAIGAATLVAALVTALFVGARDYARRDPGYSVDDARAADWAWFRANVRDARVAYTGTNLAFPLAGERLSNDVRYVNVAGAPGDRLHDFGAPGDGTAEPAPYRRGASADVWLANLRTARTEVLFVSSLYPGVRRNIAADGDGFPVERAWADARPDAFYLLHASPTARVYSVTLR